MTSEKILEMLNKHEINELREKLKQEIYCKEFKKVGCARLRKAAMTSFFKNNPYCQVTDSRFPLYPFKMSFDGKRYLTFAHPYMVVMFNKCPDDSQDFTNKVMLQLLNDAITKCNIEMKKCGEADLRNVLARAKAEGYRRLKSEIRHPKFYFHCGPDYYRIALIEITFNMLDDNRPVCISKDDVSKWLKLETSFGIAYILPCFAPDYDKFVFDMMGNHIKT